MELTVPAGWLIGATGTLTNAREVLSDSVQRRLDEARRSSAIVHVVTARDVRARNATRRSSGTVTWRFAAKNVRDFAWGTSAHYLWDATRAIVDAEGGSRDTVAIHTLYRERETAWRRSAEYERHSIEFFSKHLLPYPYPQMTAVEGLLTGGMEYPMLTLIGGLPDTLNLFEGTHHETGHMWFPMIVGSNERRYGWQDEGITNFITGTAWRSVFANDTLLDRSREQYLGLARSGGERDLMRPRDEFPAGSPAGGIAAYDKTMVILDALRDVMGDSAFAQGLREYARTWAYRHPAPEDFFHAMEQHTRQPLVWFWRAWFFGTESLDQAITSVRTEGDTTFIGLDNRGGVPMPVRLVIARGTGVTQRVDVPVSVWLSGARSTTVRVAATPPVSSVVIDPERRYPDIDRSNNVWQR